jgi:mobilome CxxCx(11)CxxC protein
VEAGEVSCAVLSLPSLMAAGNCMVFEKRYKTMEENKIKKKCWDNAIHSYGTGYIFQQRAAILKNRLKILTFSGIVVPLSIGSIVMSFGANPKILPICLFISGILGTLQLIGFAWSIVAKWDDSYGYSLDSTSANHRLSNAYSKLAESSGELTDFELRFNLLEQENQSRMDMDYKQGISENEKREGMRAALKQFQRPCVQCKQVPFSMNSSNCDVCGNFRRKGI